MKNPLPIRLGKNGRFVIPSSIRKQLNLKEGDKLSVEIGDGKIIISPLTSPLAEFYALAQKVRAADTDVVQALIQERRLEAKRDL